MDVIQVIGQFRTDLDQTMTVFINTFVPGALTLAGVLTAVFVAVKVVKSWLGEGERLDPSTLVRPCLTLAALSFYTDLVDLFMVQPVAIVTSIIRDGGVIGNLDAMRDAMTHTQDTGGSDQGGINDIVQIHSFLEFIHMAVFFMASMVGGYVLFMQLIVKTIYYMLGPFALAFSLIPGNEGVLAKWFQGFFSVLLWLPVFVVMQAIITTLPISTSNFSDTDVIFSFAFQVVMVFAVLQVPEYANILVSQGSSISEKGTGKVMGGIGKGMGMAGSYAYGKMKKKKK